MINRLLKTLVVFSFLLLTAGISHAQTADGLVKELYKQRATAWATNKDAVMDGKSRVLINKYFDKTLGDLLWKALKSEEQPGIEFDPFYNGQDAKITNLVVGAPKVSGNTATVIVTFKNFGKRDKLIYKLNRVKSAWKIADITYSFGSLVDILRG